MKKVILIVGMLILISLSFYLAKDNRADEVDDVPVDTTYMEGFNLSSEEMMKGVQGDLTWEQADSITKVIQKEEAK